MNALIGFTGFVGSLLLKQNKFDELFNSKNIHNLPRKCYDLVLCSAAPAQKWIANRDPAADLQNIELLIKNLKTVTCKTFVLISTVDVFKNPIGVDEKTPIVEDGLHPYGLHRRILEKFVEDNFSSHLIVRLPGLVGPGLRKNVIFDVLNNNNLHSIDSRGVFQFYPMVNLWFDIQTALDARLKLVHFTAEPISVAEVASQGFNMHFDQVVGQTAARYDMRSLHGELFGGMNGYQYSKRESIQAIRAYAQSEPRTLPIAGGNA